MNKLKGWTIFELAISIMIVIIISCIMVATFKPDINKSKLYLYSTYRNIMKANMAVYEKQGTLRGVNAGSVDWYCSQISDVLSSLSAPNCTATNTTGSSTVNLVFPNGVTIKGIADNWQSTASSSEQYKKYYFKDILVDINGTTGPNKIWVDQFPLRVYEGGEFMGYIQTVNCANGTIYDLEGTSYVMKHAFCGSSNKNYLTDTDILTFDILRQKANEEDSENDVIAVAISPIAADCMAYGGKGLFNSTECSGYSISEKCKNTETTGSKSASNPNNLMCMTVIHRPMTGMSTFLENIIGEINYE